MRLQSISLAIILPVPLFIPTTLAEGSLFSRATPELPGCATQCLIQSLNSTTCSILNQTCICTDQRFQDVVTTCVLKECTVKEALFTKNATATTCDAPVRDKTKLLADITVILGVITGALVALRLGFKLVITRMGLAMDDWLILATTVAGIPSTYIGVHGTAANGLGRDVWTLPYGNITAFGKFFYIMVVLYFTQITLLKMSLLFFYLRIFPSTGTRNVLWATVAFNAVFGVVFVFVAIFQCKPISYFWEKWDGEHQGKCIEINSMGWAHAAISIALDLWMLGIPLSQLPGLNLHWKKKVGVAIMFCVGTFVTVVSILRLQSLVTFANSTNPTWDNWDVTNWSTIEINVGIICATLPTARLMLVRLFPVLGGSGGTAGYYYGQRNTGNSRVGRSGARSAADGGQSDDPGAKRGGAIVYQKSFTVDYGEQDEQSLVHMRDLEGRDRATRSDRSETSL
ncbi:hypothetical protein CONLIGDRAFT_413814 [Coniochaeta ligniaria NRRL 30616]|uniref:CFEM domain-containing protein n=1 Tax=Coniochaeta ligniaria NRRL 30616 TaxID=1408157 RepID=A0A1J7IQ14_9PEZI|nr:hypothetical protein CONLIGDRAFT_413814 [Coniochaeta ligniaria NRRL 30616]